MTEKEQFFSLFFCENLLAFLFVLLVEHHIESSSVLKIFHHGEKFDNMLLSQLVNDQASLVMVQSVPKFDCHRIVFDHVFKQFLLFVFIEVGP